jgi:hypothetical protein
MAISLTKEEFLKRLDDRFSGVEMPKPEELTQPMVIVSESKIDINTGEYWAIFIKRVIDAVYQE